MQKNVLIKWKCKIRSVRTVSCAEKHLERCNLIVSFHSPETFYFCFAQQSRLHISSMHDKVEQWGECQSVLFFITRQLQLLSKNCTTQFLSTSHRDSCSLRLQPTCMSVSISCSCCRCAIYLLFLTAVWWLGRTEWENKNILNILGCFKFILTTGQY